MQEHDIIGDRYEIIEALGEGGMANVYRAFDRILQRDVSIKILRLDLRDNPTVRQRFENEISATTELGHPNIIQVYDYGEQDHLQYLVTEYVDGMDLKQYISQHQPLPINRVLEIMDGVLAGVSAAHAHEIVHRDLKPQNILIDANGNAKITDFGIATAQSESGMTATNTAIGSVHYMSPEQVKGEGSSIKSDIYALGIILYEMLTGSVPFNAADPVAIAMKHAQEPMPCVRDFDAQVPQSLENVILRATQKDAAKRYASVNDMRQDLRTVLSPDRAHEAKYGSEDNGQTRLVPIIETKAPATGLGEDDSRVVAPIAERVQPIGKKKVMKPKKRRSKWWLLLIPLVLLIALVSTLAIIGTAGPNKITVSQLTGLDVESAKTIIKQDELKVGTITHEYSDDVKEGYIIKSTPKQGKAVKVGTTVDLWVSKGVKKVRFGEYINERYSQVADNLRNKGYTVNEVKEYNDSVPSGYIISQNIDPEAKVVPKKTTVEFKVSKGQEEIVVPDFSDKQKSDVETWANDNGIKVYYDSDFDDTVTEGKVLRQTVAPNSKITKNQTVTVTLSKGKEAVTVPDFTGKTYTDVQTWATENNINVQQQSDMDTKDTKKGQVTKTTPAAGSTVNQGDTMTVFVSVGVDKDGKVIS
ncbi:MAG: Stk1 family PASTA domain-containing Ser/Thr kinase [Lactobacillaceae bacterium]|jgi:serine/threonine-protein kinase|nr:Stk1 family PASTA domain-containing Ser/Thr kinase [Lactobacillaceae bacterium]